LAVAFDPLDTKPNPDVYIAHFQYYHGDWKSSSGKAINGKVSKVSGANLDEVVDIVTGLPVSDHDHGAFVMCDVSFLYASFSNLDALFSSHLLPVVFFYRHQRD